MKSKIIKLLSSGHDLCTASIVIALNAKRSSVSKCLTRMVRTGEIHFQRQRGRVYYKLPPFAAATSESVASAAVPANS